MTMRGIQNEERQGSEVAGRLSAQVSGIPSPDSAEYRGRCCGKGTNIGVHLLLILIISTVMIALSMHAGHINRSWDFLIQAHRASVGNLITAKAEASGRGGQAGLDMLPDRAAYILPSNGVERKGGTQIVDDALDQDIAFVKFGTACPSSPKSVRDVVIAKTSMLNFLCSDGLEHRVRDTMAFVFDNEGTGGCRKACSPGLPCLMLDVGSNSGFFGLVATMHGCETHFFDIQTSCVKSVEGALMQLKGQQGYNGTMGEGKAHLMGVGHVKEKMTIKSPERCSGLAHLSESKEVSHTEGEEQTVDVVPLPDAIPFNRQVLMLKIDTEGNEFKVLKGALPLFKSHAILNTIVEVTPGFGFWTRHNISRTDVAWVFGEIGSMGYHFKAFGKRGADQVLETKEAIHDFILNGKFRQKNIWIYLPKGASGP